MSHKILPPPIEVKLSLALIISAITFDLFTPPIEQIREVSVNEIQEKVSSINLRTGKRLGYGSSSDEDTNLYI